MVKKSEETKKKVTSTRKRPTKKAKTNASIRAAGFVMIFVAVICLIISAVSGGIWFSGIDSDSELNNVQMSIAGSTKKAELIDDSIDEDEIFNSTYYNVLNVLSNSVGFGTTWLDICPNSQIEIDGEIYLKVCNDDYKTKNNILEYLSNYITQDFMEFLMGDYYIDYEAQDNFDGDDSTLYIKPVAISKDITYVGFDSFEVLSKTSEKIEFAVTSKYGSLDCGDNCSYLFKTHTFTLINEDGNWLVDSMEFPY